MQSKESTSYTVKFLVVILLHVTYQSDTTYMLPSNSIYIVKIDFPFLIKRNELLNLLSIHSHFKRIYSCQDNIFIFY